MWDFYLSKISAAPHAGNRRDVNSKATCGIAVVSFLISPLLLWRRGRQCDQNVFSEWSAGMRSQLRQITSVVVLVFFLKGAGGWGLKPDTLQIFV